MVLSALIVGVAGVSYFLIREFYHEALHAVADAQNLAEAGQIIHNAYLAIGQYRYMDWFITTPLLLLKNVLVLEVKPRKLWGAITVLLLADMFMIVTGYIGEQQFTAAGEVDAQARLFWGTVLTVGYVIIPITLFYI
jgi:sensory rhodopsin